jgi:hypothetical protein
MSSESSFDQSERLRLIWCDVSERYRFAPMASSIACLQVYEDQLLKNLEIAQLSFRAILTVMRRSCLQTLFQPHGCSIHGQSILAASASLNFEHIRERQP